MKAVPEKRSGVYELLKEVPPKQWAAVSEDETTLLGTDTCLPDLIRRVDAAGHKNYSVLLTPRDWRAPRFLTC